MAQFLKGGNSNDLGCSIVSRIVYTLLGWQLYDQIWDLLSQTGLAFLPFIGIVLRNITQPIFHKKPKMQAVPHYGEWKWILLAPCY